jgi:phage tail tape-measure protein
MCIVYIMSGNGTVSPSFIGGNILSTPLGNDVGGASYKYASIAQAGGKRKTYHKRHKPARRGRSGKTHTARKSRTTRGKRSKPNGKK